MVRGDCGGRGGEGKRGSGRSSRSGCGGGGGRSKDVGGEGLPAGELRLVLGAEVEERAAAALEAGGLEVRGRCRGRRRAGIFGAIRVEDAGALEDEAFIVFDLPLAADGGGRHRLGRYGRGSARRGSGGGA